MKRFANGLARLVFGLCVVMAAPVWAMGDNPLPSSLNPKCAGITLTGEKFLDMFHTIAMHGDLTDVPFIEKTLETKLTEVKVSNDIGKSGYTYRNAIYTAEKVSGSNIMVKLLNTEVSPKSDVGYNSHGNNKASAKIIFEYSDHIWPCLNISVDQFTGKFGGGFVNSFIPPSSTNYSVSKYMTEVSKEKPGMRVYYQRDRNSLLTYAPFIEQKWKQ